jgi:AcrR family transcriptional regulator
MFTVDSKSVEDLAVNDDLRSIFAISDCMPYEPKARRKRATNPRAASSEAQRAKTRALIIESAVPIFAKHGPDSPVIDDFVKAAGLSRGTFYNYFKTTRDLLDATLAALSDEFITSIVPIVEHEPNPVIRFATAARMFYRKAAYNPAFCAFLGSVSGVGTVAPQRARADLEEAIAKGMVKVTEIELAEAVAFGVMVFALRSSHVESGGRERAHQVVRAILNGLGADPALIDEALERELPPLEP